MNIIYQGRTKQIEKGLTVKEALEEEIKNNKYEVIGCLYNNDYKNLETPVEEGAENICKNNCVHNGESI